MADKIDQIKIGSTSYDIDLPPDATPSINSITLSGLIKSTSNATYGLSLPNTSGWTASRTIATLNDFLNVTFNSNVVSGGTSVKSVTVGSDNYNFSIDTSNLVTLSGAQTITGSKTFSSSLRAGNSNNYTDLSGTGIHIVDVNLDYDTSYERGKIVNVTNDSYTLTLPSKDGTLAVTGDIPTLYEHNVRLYNTTNNMYITFRLINKTSTAYTYSTLAPGLYDAGYSANTNNNYLCHASGFLGSASNSQTIAIVGVLSFKAGSSYLFYVSGYKTAVYASSDLTIQTTISTYTNVYTLDSTYTITDYVRTL